MIAADTDTGTTEPPVSLTGDRDLARRLPLFDVCAGLAIIGLLTAIGFRRPDLLSLASPFVIAVAAALAWWRPIDGSVQFRFPQTRVLEGETVEIQVRVHSERGLDRVEVELFASDRLVPVGSLRSVTSVAAGTVTTLTFQVTAHEWGIAGIERATIRVSDRFLMFGGEIELFPSSSVSIGMPEDRISTSLEADRFRRIVGSHLSSDRGDGLEIADVRPFQPGDSPRAINWRISNRRREPWVTLRHPDRSTTVVVILDAHDGHLDDQRVTNRRSVNAALALARGHLALHDRVGLLVVGHTLCWLPPKLGRNQLFRISDQLVSVSNAPEASRRMYRPTAVSSIPNNAIVVAVSPLKDPLMVALVAEIRSRGNPVSVLVPETVEPSSRVLMFSRRDHQARRLAAVEQLIGVQSLRERGVAVVPWATDEAVLTVMKSVTRLRAAMGRARTW